MTDRSHEAEQREHLMRAMRLQADMRTEADQSATSEARRGVLLAAVRLMWTVYAAPFRYCDWRALDDVAALLVGTDLLLARKAARLLGERGVLLVRGAPKGPANTTVKLAAMPPYPME